MPQEPSSPHLTQEGGHRNRRIIHATDATGKAVFETLQRRAQAHTYIELLVGCAAV
jgi:L-aspartate oxidase